MYLIFVATILTLGLMQRAVGGQFDGAYFSKLANRDYYTAGGEPPGVWHGVGAAALSLTGTVDATVFKHLLAGCRPDGAPLVDTDKPTIRKLGRRAIRRLLSPNKPKERVPGYDICFSCPKTVSALWAASPDWMRKQIEQAHKAAVVKALDWFVAAIPLVRRGKGGYDRRLAEVVIAMFDHGSGRVSKGGEFEPQLHTHTIWLNLARGSDGRWSGINSRALHEWTRTLGPIYRATLANELQTRLGLELTRPIDRRGKPATWFEIQDVPERLAARWSSRRGEIETLLAGRPYLVNWSDAKAREAANLKSRAAKSHIPPRSQLFDKWQAVAREFGLTKEVASGLQKPVPVIDPEQGFQKAWPAATKQLDKEQSTFTYREAVQRVCEAAQTMGIAGDWLAERTRQELHRSQEILPLGIVKGEDRYATRQMWEMEGKLLAEFEKLKAGEGATVSKSVQDKVIARHPALLADQQEAARQLLSGTGGLRILTGVAGAGKSTTLGVVRDAFEKSGKRVIGGAIAAVAKEELTKKANIPSRTVASYLHHLDKPFGKKLVDRVRHDAKQILRAALGKPTSLPFKVKIDRRTVLVLDEAGMIDTHTLLRLTKIVRERGGTVILVGDVKQLQPIGAGGPMAHVVAQTPVAHLTSNLRQQDAADQLAAEQLRRGDAKAALQNFADRGRLTVAPDRAQAVTKLVETWTDAGGTLEPQRHVIFTPTRAEAEAANRLAQRAREEAGQLDRHQSLRNGETLICRGDRVLFHKNRFADGIRNGYRGEVTSIDRFRCRVTIRLDGPEQREVTVRLRDYTPEGLTLSYAQTTHKGQSQTVDHAYLLVGGKMADREMAYVQGTRARISTHLFVDEAHAGEDLEDLARALSRSRPKELAHDIAARAKQSHSHQHMRSR